MQELSPTSSLAVRNLILPFHVILAFFFTLEDSGATAAFHSVGMEMVPMLLLYGKARALEQDLASSGVRLESNTSLDNPEIRAEKQDEAARDGTLQIEGQWLWRKHARSMHLTRQMGLLSSPTWLDGPMLASFLPSPIAWDRPLCFPSTGLWG